MNPQVPLGESVPPNTRYAVSVSLPMWEDNVDYEKGISRVVDRMVGGYPRFFIARSIQKLVTMVKDRFALPSETAMLFPSLKCAERCVSFIYDQAPKQHSADAEYALPKPGQVRIVTHIVEPINKKAAALDATADALEAPVTVYCVFFPADLFPLAKQYWQHTGDGISARLADHCLRIARVNEELEQTTGPLSPFGSCGASRRKHGSGYHRAASAVATPS
ncbi:Cystathionine gamma-synthase, partial [Coemansia sp. RSA 2599]